MDRTLDRRTKTNPTCWFLVVLLSLVACATPEPVRKADLAITGAILIDGTGAPARPGTTILVDEGRIEAVGPDSEEGPPPAVRVIDATGRYVVPGLADMHVHLGTGGLETPSESTTDRVLRQFLYYGVTTVFNVGGTGGDASSVRSLRARIASGELRAPRLYATGSLLTLPGSHPIGTIMQVPPEADAATYDWTVRGVAPVDTVEEARSTVRAHAEAGMDAIKIVVESGPTPFGDDHPQMSPEMIEAVVDEASRFGLPVVAHTSSLDELEDAVASGVRAIMHATGEPFPGPDTWAAMVDGGVFYVPTLSLFSAVMGDRWSREEAREDPFLRRGVAAHTIESLEGWQSPMAALPEDVREGQWKGLLASIGAAHDAGVPVALGTDTDNPWVFPGYSVHQELELLVEAGLTPMEALVAATGQAAKMLGREDVFGTLEPGKRGDLLILKGDPLDDIRNTRTLDAVVQGGEVLERSSLLAGS